MIKGGYIIIDFTSAGALTVGTAKTITGKNIFEKAEYAYTHSKAVMITGLTIGSNTIPSCFVTCVLNAAGGTRGYNLVFPSGVLNTIELKPSGTDYTAKAVQSVIVNT